MNKPWTNPDSASLIGWAYNRLYRFGYFSIVLLLLAGPSFAQQENTPRKTYQRAAVIRLEGEIDPLLEHYFYRKMEAAREMKSDLVIVDIESPGGLLASSVNLAHLLRDTKWAHTVAYIDRQALSGAAIVALGCDEIWLAENAKIGDAGPIYLDEGFMYQHVPEKIRSDLAREVRDLAASKGRPPALAEAMVDDDLIVFKVKDSTNGKITYKTDSEIKSSGEPDRWEKINPVHESRDKKFLETNGVRAVELGLGQGIAGNLDAVYEQFNLDHRPVVFEWNFVDTTVYILNLGLVTALLVIVGLIALFVEFSSPGIGFGGLLALLCFALFFWSRFLGGTGEWLEVLLFAVGVVFLGVELFVLPGFGVSGLAGILLIGSSLVLASQDFVVPTVPRETEALVSSLFVVITSAFAALAVCVGIATCFNKIPVLNRLTLESPPAEIVDSTLPDGAAAAGTLLGLKVGDMGVARSALRPAGLCRFGDQKVDVVADGQFIDEGTEVKIIDISGNRIMVAGLE
ncbi:MAG: hypothetical protein N2C12_16740 [Planctomycetales bacterium]